MYKGYRKGRAAFAERRTALVARFSQRNPKKVAQ